MSALAPSIINSKKITDADVVLVAIGYDATSSFGKGADQGPGAVIDCLHSQIEFYERFSGTTPAECFKIACVDIKSKIKGLKKLAPEEMIREVSRELKKIISLNKFLISLGGEHTISLAPLTAFASILKPQEVTIFQIDAHFDLRNTDEDYSSKPFGRFAHSCVMRRAIELGFKTAQVGIRAYSKDEFDFAKKNKLVVFEWGKGIHSIDKIIKSIKTDKVYLTVDVDGLDPAHMPSTGTPVQGGLEWHYANNLLMRLFNHKTVVGADIVEVIPNKSSKLTEYGAAQIIYNIIAYKWAKSLKN